MVRTTLIVSAVLVLAVGLLWTFQRHLIYFPATAQVPSAAAVIPGSQDVTLTTGDGLRLGAWFVPASRPDRGMAVLVANGNAGDRSLRAPLAQALARQGLAVLLFDYRGYGGNPGSPSEQGLARDVRAAHRFLVDEAGFPDDRLLYFGESIGAAVVTELAVEHPPAGLVLRSPFVSLAAVGQHHYPFLPVGPLLRESYPLADMLVDVGAPVAVVYGAEDEVVPPSQSRAVASAAPRLSRLVEVKGALHNDRVLLDGEPVVSAVTELADEIDDATR